MSEAAPLLIGPQEFAKLVGLGRDDTYELIRAGRIRAIRRGRKLLVPRTEAARWIAVEIQEGEKQRARL